LSAHSAAQQIGRPGPGYRRSDVREVGPLLPVPPLPTNPVPDTLVGAHRAPSLPVPCPQGTPLLPCQFLSFPSSTLICFRCLPAPPPMAIPPSHPPRQRACANRARYFGRWQPRRVRASPEPSEAVSLSSGSPTIESDMSRFGPYVDPLRRSSPTFHPSSALFCFFSPYHDIATRFGLDHASSTVPGLHLLSSSLVSPPSLVPPRGLSFPSFLFPPPFSSLFLSSRLPPLPPHLAR